MKIRLLFALVGLAIGFTVPTFAQQKDAVDPQVAEQLSALPKKFAAGSCDTFSNSAHAGEGDHPRRLATNAGFAFGGF
jgi:hypothetical protein